VDRLRAQRGLLLLPVLLLTLCIAGPLALEAFASPATGRASAAAAPVAPAAAAPAATGAAAAAPAPPALQWHLAWRAENTYPGTTTTATTCRFYARLSSSGTRLRAEFASRSGLGGYRILDASVARPRTLGSLEVASGSSQPLTFAGARSASVAEDGLVLSDPVAMSLPAGSRVLVTITASAGASYGKAAKVEPGACSETALNQPAEAPATAFGQTTGVHWLRSLLVEGPPQRSVVGFGDSITEGVAPSVVNYNRWTDRVGTAGIGVVNAASSGSALSRLGMFGTVPALQRAKELLAEPNITDLVMMIGTNDLALGGDADQVLAAMDQVAQLARSAGVKLYVCTITPRAPWTAAQEGYRQKVNAALRGTWLRERGGQLIDTDLALRDPSAPERLLSAYDGGDHLHPNAAGEQAIAAAVGAKLGLPVH
jgi:lysophospholipase L1-like esterase